MSDKVAGKSKEELKKALESDYPLIPMKEITDEARIIAVAWMECDDKNWIGQKHKLASDIMNYARRYASQQRGCGRWVKCSERLPGKRYNYHVKIQYEYEKDKPGIWNTASVWNGNYWEHPTENDWNGRPKKVNVVEWLDETPCEVGDRRLREALVKSVEIIKQWHNFTARRMPKQEVEESWKIYYENAPEMKPIRKALASVSDGKQKEEGE